MRGFATRWRRAEGRRRDPLCWVALWAAAALACAGPGLESPPDPLRYRLAGGASWQGSSGDPVLQDLRPRYPDFFARILDPADTREDRLGTLRDDLEREPADRRNFDALNAVAIAYFALNERVEARRGEGIGYMSQSFRTAKLAAVPWRAYGLVGDARVRDAILDFFADVARGEKPASRRTAPRLTRTVSSLRRKESDPGRLARIDALVARLEALEAELRREEGH